MTRHAAASSANTQRDRDGADTMVQYPYRLPTRTPERYTCARPDCNAPAVEVWVYGGACKGASFLGECADHLTPKEPERRPNLGDPLTVDEIWVVAMVADGWTWGRIARESGMSDRTMRRRFGDARIKLGGADRTNTVARAVARGLVKVDVSPPLTGLVGVAPDLGGGACSVCVVRWNRRHDRGDVRHDECRRILDDVTGGRR